MSDEADTPDTTGTTSEASAETTGGEDGLPGGEAAEAAADAPSGPSEPEPVTSRDLGATYALFLIFVLNIILAVWFAKPFESAGLQAFEDPDDVGNSLWYIVLLLAFTAFILYMAKKGYKWVIQAVILAAVGGTIAYVVGPLLMLHPAISPDLGWGIGIGAAVVGTFALWKHPEWYVIDSVGVVVAAGAAAIFGISLSVVPVVVFLVLLAIYDAIAVYKTRHMLSLADSVMELRLPVLLVVPKHWGYSFLEEVTEFKEAGEENKEEREAMFMGLGDLVMPTVLVVSALHWAQPGWGTLPATGAAIGTLVGFMTLMTFVLRGNPQAGLPLLNGGAITGFLIGVFVTTGSFVFW